jgi:hypothetical protein
LRVVDADTPGRLTSKELEEILVENVTDRVLNNPKRIGFLRGFKKLINTITGGLLFKDK